LQSTEAVFRDSKTLTVFALAVTICISQTTTAQASLKHKLAQKTQFRPKAGAPLDHLIEVADTFDIPMGIEWTESAKCKALPAGIQTEKRLGSFCSPLSGLAAAKHSRWTTALFMFVPVLRGILTTF